MSKTYVMTPKEVAKLYHVTPRTVTKWCRDGMLDAFKLGRVWRIHARNGHPIQLDPER